MLYDKLIRPDNLNKIIGKSDITYEPCFSYLRLYEFNFYNLAFRLTHRKVSKLFLTFGTLYSNLTKEDIYNIDLYYGETFFKKEIIEVTPIRFNNIDSFLNQSWKVKEKQNALCYLGNLETDIIKSRYEDRRYRCGNFNKEFLQTYKNGFIY